MDRFDKVMNGGREDGAAVEPRGGRERHAALGPTERTNRAMVAAQALHEPPVPSRSQRREGRIALWVLQALLALFFVVAAAGLKLPGEATAAEIFDGVGGQ